MKRSIDFQAKLGTETSLQTQHSLRKEKDRARIASLRELYKFITRTEKCYIIVGLVSSLILGLMLPLFYLIFGGVINEITPTTPTDTIGNQIKEVSLFFFYISGAIFIFGFVNFSLWMLVGERVSIHFREKYLEAVLQQDVEWFEMSNPAEIPTILNTQCELIKKGTGEKIGSVIVSTGLTIGNLVISFIAGWSLALILLASAPLIILATLIVTKISQRGYKDNMIAYAQAGGQAEQALTQLRTVAAFTGEQHEINSYHAKLKHTLILGKRNVLKTALSMGFFRFMSFIVFPIAVYLGGIFVREQYESYGIYGEKYNGATVMTCVFGIVLGFLQLGIAIPNFVLVLQAKAAGSVLFQVINRKPKINYEDCNPFIEVTELTPKIELDNVTFAYPTRPTIPILKNFSLTFEAGKTTAIVGATGCGKSTILELIQRFYDPQEGSIWIGEEPLTTLNLRAVRSKLVGYVGQEPVLFNMSIKENIRFGKLNAFEREIEESSNLSKAIDFINRLPKKVDSNVGSFGMGLSGGEKQRIAIARAIIRKPKILLLDQATSALDRKTQALVQSSLEQNLPGTTKIIIAHRLTTIKNADLIVVMDKGCIVEKGTHLELLEKKGVYAELVKGQINSSEQPELSIREVEVVERSHDSSVLYSPKQESEASGLAVDKVVSEEEQKLMEEVIDSDQKESQEDKRVMSLKTKKALKVLCSLSRENCFILSLGILASAVIGTFFPLIALTFADAIKGLNDLSVYLSINNQSEASKAEDIVNKNALYIFLLTIALLFFQFAVTYSFGLIGEYVTYAVRQMTFKSLIKKSPKWYEDPDHTPPSVVTSLSTDTALLNSITNTAIGALITSFVSLFSGIVVAFVYSWQLSLVMIFLAPVVILTTYMEAKLQSGFTKTMDQAYKPWTVIVSETAQNYRTVLAFANQETIMKYYKFSLMLPYKRTLRKSLCSGVLYGVSQFALFIVYGISFYVAGVLIAENLLPPDDMLRSLFSLMLSAYGAGQAQQFAPDLGAAKTATARIFNYINEPTRFDPLADTGLHLREAEGRIQFKNVWFRYPSREEWILRGVSFVVEPGQTVAIAGESGSGKSTCVLLLERFYDIQKGEILFDGVNIKDLNLKQYRQQVSIVSQEPMLFNLAIHENIIYGKREASFEEVKEAAKNANALEFIEHFGMEIGGEADSGYGVNVGPRGSQLSGGQKQRVAIARAIIKKPKLLLLDEATSALDKENEAIVQAALDRVSVNQTTIVVAHRLCTIEKADNIIVLKEGKVIESGTYKELMESQQYFYEIAQGSNEIN